MPSKAEITYYLGIDPGTNCGWCVMQRKKSGDSKEVKVVASGTWDLKPKRHEGGGMRYLHLRRFLEEILNTYTISAIGYEEVRRHLGTDAAHIYGGIVSHIATFGEENSIPYTAIPVGTIKKMATGKGRASKEDMISAANIFFNVQCEDDNEADAIWIANVLTATL